jgi:hypothetical protein
VGQFSPEARKSRDLTADGFFSSEIGIQYLGYVGNTFLNDFPGWPPVRGV